MVGNADDGSRFRDSLEVLRIDFVCRVERSQGGIKKVQIRILLFATLQVGIVQSIDFVDPKQRFKGQFDDSVARSKKGILDFGLNIKEFSSVGIHGWALLLKGKTLSVVVWEASMAH